MNMPVGTAITTAVPTASTAKVKDDKIVEYRAVVKVAFSVEHER